MPIVMTNQLKQIHIYKYNDEFTIHQLYRTIDLTSFLTLCSFKTKQRKEIKCFILLAREEHSLIAILPLFIVVHLFLLLLYFF